VPETELAGFVDHHTHLLRVAAGAAPMCGATTDDVEAFHRAVAGRGSTPMDEPQAPMPPETLPAALRRGLEKARQMGLVQLTEAGMVGWEYLDALRALRERGPLPVRVRLLVASGVAERLLPTSTRAAVDRLGDPWLDIEGVKFYADGWIGPRTCAMCRPFGDRDDAGVLFLDAETLARRADPYAQRGWTLATHAIGDRAIEACLDAYERIYGSDCAAAAPRIEHAQVLRPDLVRRMAELGVVACIQPGFAVSDARTARVALRDDYPSAYRWDELLAAGVRVLSGADYPIEPLEPLTGLQQLVTGAEVGRDEQVAQPLPLDDALSVMTDASAGTVVLDADPSDVDPGDLHAIEVLDTRPAGGP
jgi:predicted amidohydrolase YtcJ